MKNKTYLSICLVLALFLASTVSTLVHAQFTGKVCLTSPGASACPSSPPALGGSVGAQTRIAVFIQNSDGLNGFDITLLAPHTILVPIGVDLTGSVLGANPTILTECLQGVLKAGSSCQPSDTIDTLHLVAVAAPGALPGGITMAPTTGLLFTAIYNVINTASGVSVGYQTGCSSSSVSGTTICVDIANGGVPPVPETVQGARFFTGPFFTITANPSSITIIHGSSGITTITLNSVNGFNGIVNLSTTVTPTVHRGPLATLSSSSVSLLTGSSSVTLTVSTTKNTPLGTYTVAVTGTAGTQTSTVNVTVTVAR